MPRFRPMVAVPSSKPRGESRISTYKRDASILQYYGTSRYLMEG